VFVAPTLTVEPGVLDAIRQACGVKCCTTCRENKLLDEFYANPNARDGRAWACKECSKVAIRDAKYRRLGTAPRRKIPVTVDSRECTKCREMKPLSEFYLSNTNRFGTSYDCKECSRRVSREYGAKKRVPKVWIPPTEKRCGVCKEVKSVDAFGVRKGRRNGRGINSTCKACVVRRMGEWAKANPDKMKAHSAKWWKKDSRRNKGYMYKRFYGMTVEDYEIMLEKQDHKCAICGTHEDNQARSMAVDHSHKTGLVRGLLCFPCNSGMGSLGDSIDNLKKAITYLEAAEVKT